jgi:hypothetical protein
MRRMRRIFDRREKGPEAPRPRVPFGIPALLAPLSSSSSSGPWTRRAPKPQCAFEPIFSYFLLKL